MSCAKANYLQGYILYSCACADRVKAMVLSVCQQQKFETCFIHRIYSIYMYIPPQSMWTNKIVFMLCSCASNNFFPLLLEIGFCINSPHSTQHNFLCCVCIQGTIVYPRVHIHNNTDREFVRLRLHTCQHQSNHQN